MSQANLLILSACLVALLLQQIECLSPPVMDPNWPGWHCSGEKEGGKCIQILPDSSATQSEALRLCAGLKREGDLVTPSPLVINSKSEEDLAVQAVIWGADLQGGGNALTFVGPSTYTEGRLSESRASSPTGSRTTCPQLGVHVPVVDHAPPGFVTPVMTVWRRKPCNEKKEVICQTTKTGGLSLEGVLEALRTQKAELERTRKQLSELSAKLVILENSHCGVEPNKRVECGWAGITKWQCLQRGCCFDSTISGTKWCFRKENDRSKFV